MIMQLSFSLLAISTVIAGAISFEPPQGLNAYLAAHPISVTSVNETRQDSTLREQSPVSPVPLNRCPVSCAAAGTNSSSWTVYHDLNHLSLCNESMLVDFALYNPVDDEDTHLSLHACTSASEISKAKRGAQKACPSPENPSRVNSTLQLGWSGSNVPGKTENGISAVQQLQSYVQAEDSCNEEIAFAYSGDAVVGLYAGSEINGQDITGALIEQFLSYVQSNSISGTLAAQLCASTGNYSAKYAFGLILNTNADWASVQQAVRMWRDADCITKFDEEKSWHAINYLAPSPGLSGSTSKSTILNSPTPYANGTCATYKVVSGDICATIAATYDITAADIENYNNNTWGWMGCSDLQLGQYICLSSGYPPMPANVPNAVCGPQMNNTPILPPGTDFSTVNECPLNACCDIWGQCGTTAEFCTVSNSSTGAPGTAAKGQNGCISNCGTDIVYSDPPAEFIRVGYFEGYNWQRPCLSGSILSVNTSAYTHIHLAFATLNSDFSVNITSLASNFDLFASLSGVKKIISFGGWEFSTSSGSYEIFREAVQGGNRQTFINNVINLIDEYNLDGVDFDWEYPGEPDIPGIPPSSAVDAFNFYVFLADLHAAMGSNTTKSVSMTAPASFWYLQNLAIEAISEVVDYIVFMTYDLHGQWDYGAAFSDPGCPAGNCLRSDVNLTETINALSMITKAGVPSNKVVVGVTSYGRSFQMTTPGCYTEMCTYTGPDSGAIAGSCTQTAGYLGGGEIDAIVSENTSQILQYVDDSFSNILVYDNDQWVSYMDADNKETRTELYQSLNFAGTADWAVDLQSNGTTYYVEPGSHDGSGVVYVDPSIWTDPTPIVECIPPCSLVMPPLTLPTTTTVSIPATSVLVTVSTPTSVTTTWGSTTTVLAAYSPMTIGTVVDIPPYIGTTIDVWGVSISAGETTGTVAMISSIQPSLIPVVVTPVWDGTTIINGGTVTTHTGTTVIWGTATWIDPSTVLTFGGQTTITGGTTGPPVTTTLTPNPYPTTTNTSPDSTLNTKSTSYSSKKPQKTCTTGCGKPCWFFCDSGCPFCPPGFAGLGGPDGGGGGSSGDESNSQTNTNSESPTSTSTDQATITVPALGTFNIDAMLTPVGSGAMSSMWAEIAPIVSTAYPPTTATTSSPSTTTSSTSTSTATTGPDGYATFVVYEVIYGGHTQDDNTKYVGFDVPSDLEYDNKDICDLTAVVGPAEPGPLGPPSLGPFSLDENQYDNCNWAGWHGPLTCDYIHGGISHTWSCEAADVGSYTCGDDSYLLTGWCTYTF